MPSTASRKSAGPSVAIPDTWAPGTRSRLMNAMALVAAERGYAETRVSDVLRQAHTSRRTFYGHFGNREDCFFAAYDVIREDALGLLSCEESGAGPDDQLARAIDRLLEHFSAWPAHGALLMTHILGAGPAGVRRHEETMGELSRRLHRCLDAGPGHARVTDSTIVAQALVGALQRVVQVGLGGPPDRLPRLGPPLTAFALRVVD
jgi:AcrR family transcriptional regulator